MSKPKATAILSAGAPNSTLIAGALCAIWEAGKTFDTFYTSGAGATIALLYIAPKGDWTPARAMRATIEASIADEIWRMFPVGYKAFFKSGPFNQAAASWARMFQLPAQAAGKSSSPFGMTLSPRQRRFYNDMVDFWTVAMTPTDVNFFSEGLCAPYPFVNDLIDFDKLKKSPTQFVMNAYNITDGKMEEFDNSNTDARHFWAALAFPFIYAPVEIDGKLYSEGGDRDPINLGNLQSRFDQGLIATPTVVLMDVLGSLERCLVRRPRNLLDAYSISILTPVVSLALKNLDHLAEVERYEMEVKKKKPRFKLEKLKFDIPPAAGPFISDWSYSNLAGMFEVGYEAGAKFVKEKGDLLPDR